MSTGFPRVCYRSHWFLYASSEWCLGQRNKFFSFVTSEWNMLYEELGPCLRFILFFFFFPLWIFWNFSICKQNSDPLLIWCELFIIGWRAPERSLGIFAPLSLPRAEEKGSGSSISWQETTTVPCSTTSLRCAGTTQLYPPPVCWLATSHTSTPSFTCSESHRPFQTCGLASLAHASK